MQPLSRVLLSLILSTLLFPLQAVSAPTPQAGQFGTRSPEGRILVAIVLSNGADVIDFTGPWEVFEDVFVPDETSKDRYQPFELFTVAENRQPVQTSGGMKIVPQYTFDDAPPAQVVIVPAQSGRSAPLLAWIRKMSVQADVLMSVCNGSFLLADAGILNGKRATAHHHSYDRFSQSFPKITLVKDVRYVQSDSRVFTAGGLTCGIDLALHIVDLYFGRDVARNTAVMLEYEGEGWLREGAANPPGKVRAKR